MKPSLPGARRSLLPDWNHHVKRRASDGQPEKHVGQILYLLIFDTTCGTRASAKSTVKIACLMTMDLADRTEGTSRNTLLGISQVIMLAELVVNRALDRLASSE